MSNKNSFKNKFNGQIQIMGKQGISGTMNNQNSMLQPFNFMPPNFQNFNYNNNFNNNLYYQNQNPIQKIQNKEIYLNNFQQNQNVDFGDWEKIYNEDKKKNNKLNNKKEDLIRTNSSRIKNSGEMVIKTNENKTKFYKKSTTPIPKNNHNQKIVNNNNNFNNNNLMMNYNNNMNNMMYYQQNYPISNQMPMPFNPLMQNMNYQNNFNFQNFNNYNPMMMNNNPNINNELYNYNIDKNINYNNRDNNNLYENSKNKYVEYKPYSLKDYKELTRTPVVLGSLGANIGTKEWNKKREKMKKMEIYSNKINQTHKGITHLKKDTPQDEIEKIQKKKNEESIRHRTYEYGYLIKNKKNVLNTDRISVNSNNNLTNITTESKENKSVQPFNNDIYFKDLGIINENEELKISKNLNDNNFLNVNSKEINNENKNELNNFIPLLKKSDNINEEKDEKFQTNNEIINSYNNNNSSNEINQNLEQLLQQNEMYKAKINDIKDSLI